MDWNWATPKPEAVKSAPLTGSRGKAYVKYGSKETKLFDWL